MPTAAMDLGSLSHLGLSHCPSISLRSGPQCGAWAQWCIVTPNPFAWSCVVGICFVTVPP